MILSRRREEDNKDGGGKKSKVASVMKEGRGWGRGKEDRKRTRLGENKERLISLSQGQRKRYDDT